MLTIPVKVDRPTPPAQGVPRLLPLRGLLRRGHALQWSQIGSELAVSVGEITIPTSRITEQSDYKYILVYTRSRIAEQTTPAVIDFATTSDSASPVLNVQSYDQDLDPSYIGEFITWNEPLDLSQVTQYVVYLAGDVYASTRVQQGATLNQGSSSLAVPDGTEILSTQTKILVYSKSDMFEQSTPVIIPLSDTDAMVSSIQFS